MSNQIFKTIFNRSLFSFYVVKPHYVHSVSGFLQSLNAVKPHFPLTSMFHNNPIKNIVLEKTAHQEHVIDSGQEDDTITKEIISKVNREIQNKSHGRLFAIVHVCGKQFKVTDEDIIIVEGYWPPEVGEEIKLEKVLLVGGTNFSLIGRPILPQELVSVDATVIEKTLSHIKTHFRKKRRKQYMRINFHRSPYTMLRINSIHIVDQVNKRKDIEGIEGRIF